jgi:hypothetical protein
MMMSDKSQSTAYDLCAGCGHFRHLHSGPCHAHVSCGCKEFKGKKEEPDIQEQVRDYEAYLKLITSTINNDIPNVRLIDKGYAEDVARRIINVLDREGFTIKRK